MRTASPVKAAMILAALLAAATPARAQDAVEAVDRGRELYRVYCRTCHGDTGKGDGPTAEELDVRPPDLTRLSAANGGAFPTERVHAFIDGRDEPRGHPRNAMPLWGFALQQLDVDVGQEEQVRARIGQLVRYLQSIQAGAPARRGAGR